MHWGERVVNIDFRVIDRDLVIVNDVIENSLRGLSYSLRMISGLWLIEYSGSRNIFIIFSCLRKFPFFNASVTELVDEVVNYRIKLVGMILLLFLLPRGIILY